MLTEISQRKEDGKFIQWGEFPVERINPEDWSDLRSPQLTRWIPIKTFEWVGEIE